MEWWLSMAVTGAIVSSLVIIPFWQTVPPGARVGAAFNLIILLGAIFWSGRIMEMALF